MVEIKRTKIEMAFFWFSAASHRSKQKSEINVAIGLKIVFTSLFT